MYLLFRYMNPLGIATKLCVEACPVDVVSVSVFNFAVHILWAGARRVRVGIFVYTWPLEWVHGNPSWALSTYYISALNIKT